MGEEEPRDQQLKEERPAELAPGRNFYDYPPFQQKLVAVADKTQLPLSDLRTALTVVAGFGYDQPPDDPQRKRIVSSGSIIPSSLSGEELQFGKRGLTLGEALVRAKLSFNKLKEPLQMIVDALSEYPGWGKYINSQRDTRDYKIDGTFKAKDPENLKTFGIKSYAEWAAEEEGTVSDKNLAEKEKEFAIKEALPPGFPYDSRRPPEGLPRNTKPIRGRYITKKDSATIRER